MSLLVIICSPSENKKKAIKNKIKKHDYSCHVCPFHFVIPTEALQVAITPD